MPRPLVVKVTAGADDAERCNKGFTVAATAVAAGADVSLWLTGEAAWYGVPGRAEEFDLPHAQPLADLLTAVVAGVPVRGGESVLPHAQPLADLLTAVVEGGSVTVCTQCAVRREIVASDLREG